MDFFELLSLLGGIGLFLYGMKLMSDGIEAAAGDKLRVYLETLTKNRFAAVGVGAGVTGVIQSSGATTVMLVGFVNAGLMTLRQSIFVGMGANIGTTVTAQMIAFKITDWAPLILFVGVVMMLFIKKRSVRRVGQIIGGLGILFVGMNLMSQAVVPLKEWQPFLDLLSSFTNPAIGILAGLLVTCVTQSSSVTMGIMQAFAMQGIMGLDQAVYVILGVNIGATVITIIASIGTSKTARKTALAFLFFNILGVALFSVLLAFLPIDKWVASWTPDDPVRQLANFHTLFNTLTTLVLIWFPGVLIAIVNFFIRGDDAKTEARRLKYINNKVMPSPPVAVGQAMKEVNRLGNMAYKNYCESVIAFINKEEKRAAEVFGTEETVNYLTLEITDFLAKLSQEELSPVDARIVLELIQAVTDIERISDHSENIAEAAMELMEKKLKLSKKSIAELEFMSSRTREALRLAVECLENGDNAAANEVLVIEQEVDDLDTKCNKAHVKRLSKGECSPAASTVFTDIVHNLERVADHSTNLAYLVLQGDMHKSKKPVKITAEAAQA